MSSNDDPNKRLRLSTGDGDETHQQSAITNSHQTRDDDHTDSKRKHCSFLYLAPTKESKTRSRTPPAPTTAELSIPSTSKANQSCPSPSTRHQWPNRECSSLKQVRKRCSSRIISRVAHGRCLYYPGAYSSHGQLQRRQCPQMYCCRCQSQMQFEPFVQHQQQSEYSKHNTNSKSIAKANNTVTNKPEALLEIAARYVASYIPYEYIEQQYGCIPEPVQRRIIFWSFPRDEHYIRLYSSISSIFKQDFNVSSNSACFYISPFAGDSRHLSPASTSVNASNTSSQTNNNNEHEWESRSTFNKGFSLLCAGTVRQVMQIGFNLTGIVLELQYNNKSNVISSNPCTSSISSSSSLSSSSSMSAQILSSLNSSSSEYNAIKWFQSEYANRNSDLSSAYRKNPFNGCLVSITFDRCKITSATCTCTPKVPHLFWCEHVVALALYRIYKPNSIDLRIPISETLLDLDRQQLQKLVQYLIAEHHLQILPTVQRLADELGQKHAPINLIPGAPDPTAGACVYGPHDWYLNEERTALQIRDLVKFVSISESNKIILLFYKVIEMLKIKDSNGSRFLRIITEQFLYCYSNYLKLEDAYEQINFDPFFFLWDHLTNLWIFIVSDPSMPHSKRIEWRERFRHWSHISSCPREDTYFSLKVENVHEAHYVCENEQPEQFNDNNNNNTSKKTSNHHQRTSSSTSYHHHHHHHHHLNNHSKNNIPFRKRRILERALDATYLSWNDAHLQMILRQDGPIDRDSCVYYSDYFDKDGFAIFSEHLPTAAVRVASLRVNGRTQEALRLSMAIVRYFRHQQHLQEQKQLRFFDVASASESWIGNPLDPIGILFDTLAEASLASNSKSFDAYYALVGYDKKIDMGIFSRNVLVDVFVMYNEVNSIVEKDNDLAYSEIDESNDKPKYQHVQVPGSKYPSDSYLNAALYIALVGLSQHRRSPDIESQRDRNFRQEERLIRKLLDIKLDEILISTLSKQARFLIDYGLLSDMVTGKQKLSNIPVDIVQIPGLVRYMFGALLKTAPHLSYEIGLRSLRFFAFKDEQRSSEVDQLPIRSNFGLYLDVQSLLARTMIFAARNDYSKLLLIFETIKTYVIDPHYLNKLAQDIFNFSSNGPRQEYLLRIAYEFGKHLTMITLNDNSNDNCRKSTIHWLVTCATEIGCDEVLYLMKYWRNHFSPSEAVRHVASAVLAPNFNTRLCNHIMRFEELTREARELAVECAKKDPSSCALNALSLCEKDPVAFEIISDEVENSAAKNQINSHKLFTIARYMEHQGKWQRACKIALLAAKQVVIPLAADSHHSINDLQWACSIAQRCDIQLTKLVKIIIKNVRCAPVLADMIRRCTLPHTVVPHTKHVMIQNNAIRPNHFVSESSNQLFVEHLNFDERIIHPNCHPQPKTYSLNCPPLSDLVAATREAYIEAVMRRLEHISPRHYSDFIEFLTRAQETIILESDGKLTFAKLLETIKTLYKGKKKLMCLVKERFG